MRAYTFNDMTVSTTYFYDRGTVRQCSRETTPEDAYGWYSSRADRAGCGFLAVRLGRAVSIKTEIARLAALKSPASRLLADTLAVVIGGHPHSTGSVVIGARPSEASEASDDDSDDDSDRIVEHDGRYYWAWFDERANQWRAPTPAIGGYYVGSRAYVCSGAAISASTREELIARLGSLGVSL